MSIYGDSNEVTKTYIDSNDLFIKGRMQDFANYVGTIIKQLQKDKHIITICAEESGPLRNGSAEFAFGNGASGAAHGECGYTMMCKGRVLRMAISSVSIGGFATELVKVGITVNGTPASAGIITKAGGHRSAFKIFDKPIELNSGSVLNFISLADCAKKVFILFVS